MPGLAWASLVWAIVVSCPRLGCCGFPYPKRIRPLNIDKRLPVAGKLWRGPHIEPRFLMVKRSEILGIRLAGLKVLPVFKP